MESEQFSADFNRDSLDCDNLMLKVSASSVQVSVTKIDSVDRSLEHSGEGRSDRLPVLKSRCKLSEKLLDN